MATLTMQTYPTKGKKWTWRLKAENGKIIANAAEDYERPSGAKKAANRMAFYLQRPGQEVKFQVMNDQGGWDTYAQVIDISAARPAPVAPPATLPPPTAQPREPQP